MPQEVFDLPGGAGRDGCIEAGPAGRVGEQVTLAA
jgi:hypothetical protein